MSKHVNAWLEAYYDGELSGRRLAVVEQHLVDCEACQKELNELTALTDLLHESSPAENLTRPDQFVAQVGLKLPRRQIESAWQRTLKIAWQAVPVALVIAWAVVQAAHIVTNLVSGMQVLNIGGDQLSTLLGGTGSFIQSNLRVVDLIGFGLTLNLVVPIIISLLYLSWIAGWWVSHRKNKLDNHMS